MPNKVILRHCLILLAYAALAVVITWPAVTTLNTRVIGSETGDSFEMLRNVWYFAQALREGEPLLWQPLLGYPDGISGTIFITVPLQYGPMTLLALFLPLTLSYNVVVLLYMALNGWALYWLMRYLLADEYQWPSFIAGVIYMAFPVFQAHLAEGHGGLIMGWAVPLFVWALLRYTSAKHHVWRWLLLSVLFFWLSTTGHILQAIYVLLPLLSVFFLVRLWRRDWRSIRRLLLLGLLAGGGLGLLFLPVILESASEVAYTETTGYVRFSADALSLVTPSFFHPLFDSFLTYPRRVLGTNITEGAAYIGVITAALALIGLVKQRTTRWWLLLGGVAWLLSLGPLLKVFDQTLQMSNPELQSYFVLPFALLQELPGFSLARTPGRFNFTVALVVAVLAGYGLRWLWSRQQGHSRLLSSSAALLLIAGILFEYQFFWPMPTRSTAVPQAVVDLGARDEVRAVFNVPYEHLLAAKDALYLQTAHGLPLIAGQITRQTPVNPAKLAIMQATLDPALLRAAGADVVIFHRARAEAIGTADALQRLLADQLGEPNYADDQIAVYDVPQADATPTPYLLDVAGEAPLRVDFYLPKPGFITIRSELSATDAGVSIALNDTLLTTEPTSLGAYIADAGYHSLYYLPDAACPTVYNASLFACVTTHISASFEHYAPGSQTSVNLGAMTLLGSTVYQDSATPSIGLHWQFTGRIAANDVRFVHIMDDAGEIVWQLDEPLGMFDVNDQHGELISVDVPLQPGRYNVRVGWYSLDGETLTPYVDDAGQASVQIGTITIE